MCVQRIVNKSIGCSVWLLFVQRARAEHAVCVAVLRIEVESFWIRSQRFKVVGVFPFAIRAGVAGSEQIISDLIFEERRFRSRFHGPVVPLAVQVVEIDDCSGAKLYTSDFISGRARAGMVPRSNDEKMFGARLRRGVCDMIPVICERTQFVAVVLTCNC